MAQSSLYLYSHDKLTSPVAKRSCLSLKQNKPLLQESSAYFVSKQEPGCKCVQASENSVQDENASPNCSFGQSKQIPLATQGDRIFAPGLPNCGNTCYINSILQVLRFTPNFLNCVHLILSPQMQLLQVSSSSDDKAKEMQFFLKLHTLYIAMKKQEMLSKNVEKDLTGSLLRPVKSFLLSLREVSSMFEEGEQHDAHEVLLAILSFVHSLKGQVSAPIFNNAICVQVRDLRLRRQHQAPLIEALDLGFEGRIRHCIRCLECERKLERTELFTNLEVPIADSLVVEDTVDLLQCLSQKTMLYGENKYFCDECYHLSEAQISSQVVFLPTILLLHCSWLRQSSSITESEKDFTRVLIPMSLRTSENTELFCCSQDEKYILYAIVLHLGKSTEGGHYVCFVKDTSASDTTELCCGTAEILNFKLLTCKWLLFDDEIVTGAYVNESSEIFPYFDFLGITATPCLIFYYKL